MLDLIINNNNLASILTIIIAINFFLYIINAITSEIPNDLKEVKSQNNKLKQTEIIIALIEVLFILLILFKKFSNILFPLIIISQIILLIIKIFQKKDVYTLTEDNIYMHLISSTALIIIFNKNFLNIILKIINPLPHYLTEITLILFVGSKILLLIFELIINILILISFIDHIMTKKQKIFFSKIKDKIEKPRLIYFKYYHFQLYNKKALKRYFIIDCIIYSILLIPTLFYNIMRITIVKISLTILRYILKKVNYCKNFYIYKEKNTRNIMKFLTIITIITINIIIYTREDIFSESITNIYNFIATSILIPLFYDKIVNRNINN